MEARISLILTVCGCSINPGVPTVVVLDKLLTVLILDNALSNATIHGMPKGDLALVVSVLNQSRLLFCLTNFPGRQHAENCELQASNGVNFHMATNLDTTGKDVNGSVHLTSQGMSEIREMSLLMNAEPCLEFEADRVCFSLSMPLQAAGELGTNPLPHRVVSSSDAVEWRSSNTSGTVRY